MSCLFKEVSRRSQLIKERRPDQWLPPNALEELIKNLAACPTQTYRTRTPRAGTWTPASLRILVPVTV